MKKKNPIHAYKRLLANDQDWDFAFLIALEKKKLQRMHNYFKSEGHPEVNKLAARDIAICIRLIDKLEYLAGKYGVKVQKVYRFFPSSKLCDCNHVYKNLALHDREWTCPVCGLHHDRDLHAANNILRQGIASLGSPGKTRELGKVTVRWRKQPRIPRL